MGLLAANGVKCVYHFAPLHYLPFIARSGELLGKPSLKKAGYKGSHLRSMSARHDISRGFGPYAHLTLDNAPRILKAKIGAGFPHIAFAVCAEAVDDAIEFSLCRFNVAMTRYLRRNGRNGFPESETNGRYYTGHQIPIARTEADKNAMLKKYVGTSTMIEVLAHGDVPLPENTNVICYSDQDADLAKRVLAKLGSKWAIERGEPPGAYPHRAKYQKSVREFIDTALANPEWRGNGLEFDRV